jgi:anthranilate/para-aminobenzoate synthase component I
MRNDLGRVCEFGSVRVDEPRVIERHGGRGEGGVWQGVATVSGTVRAGLDLADVLRATFPPGSVTGAPKIRAMQIIDELEPVPRGPYCGAIGFISDCGRAAFNVAIRTAVLHSRAPGAGPDGPWTLDYSVGAGIVADSRPDLEWRETLAKAGALLGSGAGAGVGGLARLAEESP